MVKELQSSPMLFAGIVFLTIFILNWLGYRARCKMHKSSPGKEITLGAAEASLFGLMTFLLAFSFGIASTRFENRRQVIIDEANNIGTVIMRAKLFPDSTRQILIPDLKQYLESRIAYYDAGDRPSQNKIGTTLNDANKFFESVWNHTHQLIRDKENQSQAEQLVPVLISMKNSIAIREAGRRATFPMMITIVLLVLIFVSSFLMGFGVKPGHRHAVISLAFALMTTVTLILVMEFARAREGFINLGSAQQNMIELRKMFQ